MDPSQLLLRINQARAYLDEAEDAIFEENYREALKQLGLAAMTAFSSKEIMTTTTGTPAADQSPALMDMG